MPINTLVPDVVHFFYEFIILHRHPVDVSIAQNTWCACVLGTTTWVPRSPYVGKYYFPGISLLVNSLHNFRCGWYWKSKTIISCIFKILQLGLGPLVVSPVRVWPTLGDHTYLVVETRTWLGLLLWDTQLWDSYIRDLRFGSWLSPYLYPMRHRVQH